MSHFTEDQLRELETVFGLTRGETRSVRDGVVMKSTKVWWRCTDGPQLVTAGDDGHWENIRNSPFAYQLAEPSTKIQYMD